MIRNFVNNTECSAAKWTTQHHTCEDWVITSRIWKSHTGQASECRSHRWHGRTLIQIMCEMILEQSLRVEKTVSTCLTILELIEEPVAHIIKWTLKKWRKLVNQWVYTGTYLRPELLVVGWGARCPVEELQQLRASSHKEHQLLEEKEKHEIDSPAWISVTKLTKCKIN